MSGSANIKLGIQIWPVGTPQEVEAAGMSPAQVASCARPSKDGSGAPTGAIRGCPVWDKCRFDAKKLGAFKGEGPRNIGYYLETHEGHKKEDSCSCYSFVNSLQDRMNAGIVQRQSGQRGEIISVIAQEGEKITTRTGVPVDPKDPLRTKGYHYEMKSETVPKHPRIGDNVIVTYDDEITQRQRERERLLQEAEDAVYNRIDPNEGGGKFEAIAEPVKKVPK